MPIVNLTDDNFENEVLKAKKPVLVDFWAVWCGPCQMQEPIIEELAAGLKDKVKIAKLNVDENPKTASQYNVMSIPTLKIFKSGKEIETLVGVQTKETLAAAISKHL